MINLKKLKALSNAISLLYVEDEILIRDQQTIFFEGLFKKVFVAKNGANGLQLFLEHAKDIDLVVTDINMPIMDGIDMVKQIKNHKPEVHAILVSAHNDNEFLSRAIQVQVDAYLFKPIQSDILINSLLKSCTHIVNQKSLNNYNEELEMLLIQKTHELENHYFRDSLTGVCNREKLINDLKNSHTGHLLLVSLNHFDVVNTNYGIEIADNLLKEMSRFLTDFIGTEKTLYRIGGATFGLVLDKMNESEASLVATNLMYALESNPFSVLNLKLKPQITIGLAEVKTRAQDSLIHAQIAVREANAFGQNKINFYSKESEYFTKQKNTLYWMQKIQDALDLDQFVPYFQPIISNQTKEIWSYECLLRMKQDEELILPSSFLETARKVGLIPKITEVMLKKSFAFFKGKNIGFSINITEEDLLSDYLPALLENLCSEYSITSSLVTLEIQENVRIQENSDIFNALTIFKEMGFHLALDDFGSDKSNLSRLQKLNIDIIKIDGAFIRELDQNPNNEIIVRTITNLAKALGSKVVAESVMTIQTQDILVKLGVDYSQGFLFGEPSPDLTTIEIL